ncbi:hypothetical protein Avbf_17729 [Armadillidium vulgare]|nr:hypothetical protein Avbf_17729 [Armadillidium vulgare]
MTQAEWKKSYFAASVFNNSTVFISSQKYLNADTRFAPLTKSSITLSLEVLDKCLEKLEQLTLPGRRVNIVNVKKILNEVKGDLKKTMVCDNLKSTVSILLSDFHGSYEYLEEMCTGEYGPSFKGSLFRERRRARKLQKCFAY